MLPLNTHIGHYRLVEFLGMGGMGEVYRAVHTRIDRVVALKVLNRTAQDPKAMQRFLNEARIHASLHHPTIVTLYDFLEFNGNPCIVMEYVNGLTLADYLRVQGALPIAEATFIIQRLLRQSAIYTTMGWYIEILSPTTSRSVPKTRSSCWILALLRMPRRRH